MVLSLDSIASGSEILLSYGDRAIKRLFQLFPTTATASMVDGYTPPHLAPAAPAPPRPQSTSLSQEDLTVGEARAHVLTPSEEVPGGFFTMDGWSVSLVGNEVCGEEIPSVCK